MLRRVGTFVAMILVATFVLAACGSPNDEVKPTVTRTDAENAPPPPTATSASAATEPAGGGTEATTAPTDGGETPAGAQTTFDVEMKDIAFSVKEITVPANTEITINLVNNGAATHNFDIPDLEVASGDYASGQTGTVTFNSGAAGEHEFFCNIPGHKEAGMVGKLIVTDAAPAAEPAATEETAVTPAADGGDAGAAAAQTTFDVEMKDIAFNVKEITVPANTDITINLVNNGAATHNFDITDLNVASGDYAPGQTGTVTFNSGAAGEHEFFCNIPGHKEAGMVGKLIVTDAPAPAADAGTAAATEPAGSTAASVDASPAASPAASPVAPVTTLDITLEDIKFSATEFTVPANTEITVNLTNGGAATHNFNIDALGVASGDIAAGETKTLTFNSGAAGEYEFYCNIPGHKDVGMVGKLTVVDGAVAPPPPAGGGATETSFNVEMKDIAFVETELTVPANSEITINLTNTGAATHNFNIDDLNASSGDYVAGQTGTVTFKTGAPGEYQYYCNIPGHKEAGMVGKLIVK